MRMPVMVWRPATSPATTPAATGRSRRGPLVDWLDAGRTATEQTPEPALQYGPGHQTVLVDYGDDHRSS
jgi:hypothetical protein